MTDEPEQSSKCISAPFRATLSSCQPILRSTIYPWRHSVGSNASRLGLWEFYHEFKIIRENGLVAVGHSSKHSLYHIIVRRARSNHAVTQVKRKITAVYTIYRDQNEATINDHWHRLSPIINTLFPFLRRRLHVTELRILKDIFTVTIENQAFTAAHVAAKLQFVSAFKRKNTSIIHNLNEQAPPIGQTPLMIAIQSQNLVLVKALVDLGASLHSFDGRLDSILHYAALSNLEMFKWLIETCKAKFNLVKMLRRRNKKGYSPLHWCCYSGRTENLLEILKMPIRTSLLVLEPQQHDQIDKNFTSDISDNDESNGHHKKHKPIKEDLSGLINYKSTERSPSSPSISSVPLQLGRSSSSSTKQSLDTSYMSASSSNDEHITFTQEMIDDLDTSEMLLGGSPIHWAKTRRLLEHLLDSNSFPLECVNFRRETPLHVMTRRRRLKCAVMLLSRGVDVSVQDSRGNTPIHRAIQREDISMVQGLIAFDADINGLNARKQTPRHIAATRGTSISKIIVNVLHRVGAKRCPPKRKKCTEDCAYESEGIGTPFPKWADYVDESPYSDFMSSRGDSPVQETQSRAIEGDSKLKAKDYSPARVICLDGGGTRGLFTCCALIEIERRLKKPLREYFEWFAGTSSGALIASLIVLGTPLHRIRSVYYQFKDKIFVGQRPYNSDLLEKLIKDQMGSTTKMGDIKDNKKLLITAVLTHQNPAQLYVFRNIPSTSDILGRKIPSDPEYKPNFNEQIIWQACRASGAAPSYFKAFGPFIDGGILANNPTLDVISEFFHYNKALINVGKESEVEKLSLVLSMGTGRAPIVPARLVELGPIMSSSFFTLPEAIKTALSLQELVHMMISTTLQTDGHVNKRTEAWCSSLSIPYFRFNPPMSEDLQLNVTDDIEVVNGMWETKAYMYALSPYLDKLVNYLEAIEKKKSEKN
ncbi:85/88 kDa calcium-independent phospholipase A2-like [Tetranychus urticae]|uniref:85/88 kDa calcium-independent phospholipase A2-like n=1 Tax=Tetranychus urticae TaxID=32264 RepID=UPI000D6528ED|nr:85/88 kDa calcium-independent phospholipase A2-like [Tetranychus urticae]